MSDDQNDLAAAPADAPASAPGRRSHRPLAWIGGGAAFLVLVGVVALLRPGREEKPAEPEAAEPATARPDPAISRCELPCSRPAAGAHVAALVQADAAYDSGEFSKARDLYLDLLLAGGDLGGGDDVECWAEGRLALCMARIARGREERVIDDPPLAFREAPK